MWCEGEQWRGVCSPVPVEWGRGVLGFEADPSSLRLGGHRKQFVFCSKSTGEQLKDCWQGRGYMLMGLVGRPGSWEGVCRSQAPSHLSLPGSALQAPQRGRRKKPFREEDSPVLFKESSYCLVPRLPEPIKPCIAVIIGCQRPRAGRLGICRGRVGCCWPTGAVTPAWLLGREGADTKAPIKSPQSRQLLQAFRVGT